jgi:hypothetical protein
MDLKKFLADNKKTILIVVGLFLLAFFLKKYWWKVERFFKPRASENSPIELTDSRKSQLQAISNAMFQDIENTPFWTGHDYTSYEQTLAVYDDELKYMADYFKNFSSAGEYSMKVGIDSQVYTWGDSPAQVSNRLSELGKF